MANPKMQVEASIVLDSSYVRIKRNEETRSKVKALLHLEAAAAVQRGDNIRVPIPVAVVVDVQGSTHQGAAGARSRAVKVGCAQDEATREFTFKKEMWESILGEFRPANGNDDIIVIAGNSWIKLMSELTSSPQDNPMAECVTDLKPVLKVAMEELNKPRPSSVVGTGQRGFIILVSDGGSEFTKDDEYEAFCNDLSKYPVHAFGLGFGNNQHDSEWEVLRRIVSISKGTFSYIPVTDDREKLDRDVVQGIASCLGGLATVVAMDMRVEITCVTNEKTNCIKNLKIEKIQSGGFDSSIIPSRQAQVSVGYLSEGEAKDLIVHVAFNSDAHDHTDRRWLQLIATVEYDYYHYNSGSSSWHKQKQTSKERIECEVKRASDKASYKMYETRSKQPNPEVLEQMIRSDVVQMLLRFAAEGSQDGSKEKSAGDLRSRWEELKQPEGGNLQMGARLRKIIRRIGMDIEAMALSLERGCGLGCIYSWVSSNEMQRATTTSLPPPTAAAASPFLTPAMEAAAARNVSKHYLVAAAKKERPTASQTLLETVEAQLAAERVEREKAQQASQQQIEQIKEASQQQLAAVLRYVQSLGPVVQQPTPHAQLPPPPPATHTPNQSAALSEWPVGQDMSPPQLARWGPWPHGSSGTPWPGPWMQQQGARPMPGQGTSYTWPGQWPGQQPPTGGSGSASLQGPPPEQ